jgi:hypothetical protein
LAVEFLEFLQDLGSQHRAGPRPKILCRKILAANFAKVFIDVFGIDVADLTIASFT